jgi:hypothetical protein
MILLLEEAVQVRLVPGAEAGPPALLPLPRLHPVHIVVAHDGHALPEALVFLHTLFEPAEELRLGGEPDELLGVLALLGEHVQDHLRVVPKHAEVLQHQVDLFTLT